MNKGEIGKADGLPRLLVRVRFWLCCEYEFGARRSCRWATNGVCLCKCVSESERERVKEREIESKSKIDRVRESERERERPLLKPSWLQHVFTPVQLVSRSIRDLVCDALLYCHQ